MPQVLIELTGWLPAIVFPSATLLQLIKIWKAKSVSGVSSLSWFLFGVANLGTYVYAQKYGSLPSILGFLGTALLDFAIVAAVFIRNNRARDAA